MHIYWPGNWLMGHLSASMTTPPVAVNTTDKQDGASLGLHRYTRLKVNVPVS